VLRGGNVSLVKGGQSSARSAAKNGGVVVQSMARNQNGLEVWRKVEKINADTSGAPVDADGTILCKVAPPNQQISNLVAQLAAELRYQDGLWVKPYMERYLAALDDVDWTKEKDVRKAFDKAGRVLRGANVQPLVKPWVQRVEVYGRRSARDGRQWLRQAFLPRISGNLTGADQRAVKAVSEQQGWWLRDMTGRRSDRLTARGREIVAAGLKDGLGRASIADNLKLAMPDLWNKYGNQYAQVVASVAVNRARSFSTVNSYQDAGIQELEVVAVLDERTTEQCRFMDGQILVVNDCGELLNNSLDMKVPEDIKTVNPFINVVKNDQGIKELITARGDKLGEIVRSGYGIKDDRGAHRQFVSGRAMPTTTAIGMPPYHHLCRTTTIPVFRTFQVPNNYMARTIPGPSPIPQTIFGLSSQPALRAIKPADRPITLVREPTPKKPVSVGYKDPLDPDYAVGLDAREDLATQVKTRVSNAVRVLQEAITKAIRENSGRTMSQAKKGETLRNAISEGAGKGTLQKTEITLSRREYGDMSYAEQRRILKLVESVLGSRMWAMMGQRTFPRVIEWKVNKIRPQGSWDGEVLVLPRVGTSRADSVILSTITKYLDEFGKNAKAGVLARNGACIGKELVRQGEDVFIQIRGADWRAGKVYGDTAKVTAVGPWNVRGGSQEFNDWSSIGNAALTDGQQDRLALLWDMNPEHVGFVAAYIEGQFV
jgi:SPP1 gp7 family putative phage head morphogenesis protein